MSNTIIKNLAIAFIVGFFFTACSTKENNNNITVHSGTKKDSIRLINVFFSKYKEDPHSALDTLLAGNKFIDKNSPQIIEMKQQLTELIPQLGEYYGYELITKNTVSSRYVLYSYIVYYERQPIRFNIVVYKIPNEEWKVQNFQFDVNLLNELTQSGQIYFLNKIFQ